MDVQNTSYTWFTYRGGGIRWTCTPQILACKEDNFCSFKRSCIDMFSPRFSDLPPPLNYAHTSFYEILFDWQGFFSSFMSDLILRIYMKILEQKTIHSKLIMEWKYEFYTRSLGHMRSFCHEDRTAVQQKLRTSAHLSNCSPALQSDCKLCCDWLKDK